MLTGIVFPPCAISPDKSGSGAACEAPSGEPLSAHEPTRRTARGLRTTPSVSSLTLDSQGLAIRSSATLTHDYKRNGVTTLYAAMDVQSGLVIGACKPRHRAREFIAFLRRIDRCVQRQLDVHVVLDNSSTHKTPEVRGLARKARSKPWRGTKRQSQDTRRPVFF